MAAACFFRGIPLAHGHVPHWQRSGLNLQRYVTRAPCVASAQVPNNKKMASLALCSSGRACRSPASVCAFALGPSPHLLLHAAALSSDPGRVQGPTCRRLFRKAALAHCGPAGPGARTSPALLAKK
ncbi:hypothetical protein NDU88_001535 [Pleurodeles waltl]|uniref:Uncharacterized protein n=1 Tax=Pleurodeles waltl TaxID=8319 RepID=A0AAV7SAQ3_PLEWA|nr:hypothetical protein NDU88_001535 [Pleurodeles waltl]